MHDRVGRRQTGAGGFQGKRTRFALIPVEANNRAGAVPLWHRSFVAFVRMIVVAAKTDLARRSDVFRVNVYILGGT